MSARDQEFDRILGLEMGSEDYITKPFSMREMVLRVKNVLKRHNVIQSDRIISYKNYTINEQSRGVYSDDKKISLTSKELDLLFILLKNKGTSQILFLATNHPWVADAKAKLPRQAIRMKNG